MSKIQKIMPCLWFDSDAEEAVSFYSSLFKSSKILNTTKYNEVGYEIHGKKAGTVLTIRFSLDGCEFLALNGGPQFKFNPSISFFVNCSTQKEIDDLWENLLKGGQVLMELGKYPFSERFGWVQDRFGLSWQLNLGERKQKITPFIMYVGEQHGKAEGATEAQREDNRCGEEGVEGGSENRRDVVVRRRELVRVGAREIAVSEEPGRVDRLVRVAHHRPTDGPRQQDHRGEQRDEYHDTHAGRDGSGEPAPNARRGRAIDAQHLERDGTSPAPSCLSHWESAVRAMGSLGSRARGLGSARGRN